MCFLLLGKTCTNTPDAVTSSLESFGLQSSHFSPCFREALAQETPSSYQLPASQKEVGLHTSAYLEAGACLFQQLQPSSLTSALPQAYKPERGESVANHLCALMAVMPRYIPLVQVHTPLCLVHLQTMLRSLHTFLCWSKPLKTTLFQLRAESLWVWVLCSISVHPFGPRPNY